jgi:hypothetical protein
MRPCGLAFAAHADVRVLVCVLVCVWVRVAAIATDQCVRVPFSLCLSQSNSRRTASMCWCARTVHELFFFVHTATTK